jgi:ATP-dependent protease ClpP protease subunit
MGVNWDQLILNKSVDTKPRLEIVNKAAEDIAELWIYGDIGSYDVQASNFLSDLSAIEESTIEVHLNTRGGNAFDGIAIYNVLVNHPAHIRTVNDSIAASAGSVIFMAGDERITAEASRLMIHDALVGVSGSFNLADLKQLIETSGPLLDGLSNDLAEIYRKRAGGTVKDWRAKMLEETWFSAKEAVTAGLATATASVKKKSVRNGSDAEITNSIEPEAWQQRLAEFKRKRGITV